MKILKTVGVALATTPLLLAGCGGVSYKESSDAFYAAKPGELYPTVQGCTEGEKLSSPLASAELMEGAECRNGVLWMEKKAPPPSDWELVRKTCTKDEHGLNSSCSYTKRNKKTGELCIKWPDGTSTCTKGF